MLKAEHIRPRLVIRGGQVWTKPIPVDYYYLDIANDLISLFQRYVGHSHGELDDALRDYEGDSLDYPVIRGLATVIASRCTFNTNPPVDPTDLRAMLSSRGPVTAKQDLFHPAAREHVLAEAGVELGLTVEQVEAALFADLVEEQILIDSGELLTPGDLIARYNMELARGLLYWAREVRLQVRDGYKDLFKYIKLFKLMYTIRPLHERDPSRGYHMTLHGPISPFVKSTIRYGLQFAKFLPALLLCEHWQMEADVQPPRSASVVRYTLNDQTDLRTHFRSSGLFDSQLEADFAAEFEAKYGGVERKWELDREDELILTGDTVMIPDFSFTHRHDGRRALLEIVGFWHPDYLRRKIIKVRQAGRQDLILLVYKSANVSEAEFEAASAGEVLFFARKPVLKDVLAAVERCAVPAAETTQQPPS
ncbi:MAG: DUF790 family protein [Anaerolineae bacterium]|nr:DUF790 family protein [Anaerolineae bacterium]